MPYNQLTQTNRIEIAILFRTGLSHRAIAKQVGCHHSTVGRELKRHSWHNPSGYDARQTRLQLARSKPAPSQTTNKCSTSIYYYD